MCGKRGLLPDTDEQTFEVAVTQTFKIHYNKNITALQAEVTESIHPSIHSSIHPSIHSSIHSFIHPSIDSFIHLFLHRGQKVKLTLELEVKMRDKVT